MRRMARLFTIVAVGAAFWHAAAAGATWTIAAVDTRTGDVGAAGAGCVDADLIAVAGLVPRSGAVAAQGEYLERGRDLAVQQVGLGRTPVQILTALTGAAFEPDSARRQYGIATTSGSGAFTGSKVEEWSGDRNGSGPGGNAVVIVDAAGDAEVAGRAFDAFQTTDRGPLHLTDRLMLALEAGSAAGGDKRCNVDGITQTARSAFLVAARPEDPVFAAPSNTPLALIAGLPWLAVSEVNGDNRENPILDVRAEYDAWRAVSLPPCPDCNLDAIPVPEGDRQAPPPMDWGDVLGVAIVVLAAVVIVAVVSALTVAVLRRRRVAGTAATVKGDAPTADPDLEPGEPGEPDDTTASETSR
ncbi:MAG: DUF1028 domain-containing protein [Acidimicrobiia bacterium]|nr:DUF1028 domain-containing protein [Acidimicrobiia bacterium]